MMKQTRFRSRWVLSARVIWRMVLCFSLAIGPSVWAAEGAVGNQTTDWSLYDRSNLVAWCIVPFDARKRGPEERAAMLEKLGLRRFAYDYRTEHIPTFDREVEALKRHHVELLAWWFPTELNDEARGILEVLKRHQVKAQLWVMGGGSPTRTAEEQAARVAAEARRIGKIADEAAKIGCSVALYNHGSWFGEPENQLAIIEKLGPSVTNVGIVYNLHHGHEHLERFPQLLERMKPHLFALNLNGMTRGGEQPGKKILPLGQGDLDLELLRMIQRSGWRGPVGILNHTDEDAEARLQDNLDGLDWLLDQLQGKPAKPRPVPRSWTEPKPPTPPRSTSSSSSGLPSLSPSFGKALAGSIHLPAQPGYRSRPITVECRAKLENAHGFNILVASEPKSSAEHWELYTYAGSGVLSLYQPGRGGEVKSDAPVCDGTWHRLAAVIEPLRVRLFVDGACVKDVPVPPVHGTPVDGGLAIGSLVEGGIGCQGLLDDVRLSTGVREIAVNMSEPLTRDGTTLGLWSFDDLPTGVAPTRASVPTAQPENAAARARLPEFHTIPAAEPADLAQASGVPNPATMTEWHRSLGDAGSARFSSLQQIHRDNVRELEMAWTYHSKDGKGNIQCNPIVVNGVMFAPTVGHRIVAVNAVTGEELWSFQPEIPKGGMRLEDLPARRGLLFWPGDGEAAARVIFGCGNWIYALDPKSGKPLPEFGKAGRTEIPAGCTAVGAVYRKVLVYPGFNRDVFGYDVTTGRLLWTFHTVPHDGEAGRETWDQVEDGANCWGGMAMDEHRGIAYVSTGSPKPNFVGTGHRGDNLYSNCVLALDALTGKLLWHFQEIRHDIWDLDIPAPPNLVTVNRSGRRVDAVAQVTKLGNTLLLDRVSGKPLFPVRLRRAPASTLPGEQTSPYQPDLELPEPFARQIFRRDDITTRSEEAWAFVSNRVAGANVGWFQPFQEGKPTVLYGVHGGAEWTGAAFDPTSGCLYVSANELPWIITVFRDDPEPPRGKDGITAGERLYQQACATCHGPDRVGVGTAPPLRGLRHRLKDADVVALLKTGRNLMPAAPPMTDADQKALLDFLFLRDRPAASSADPSATPRFTHNGYPKLLDQEGYPGNKPPWGTLNCIDLNSGKLRWKVPLGEYPELTAQGIAKTGTENFGGAMVTGGGLVFCAGTRDQRIRAFDKETGQELWSRSLPWGGYATPATYMANGRQFVVIAASGGGKLGGPTGDAWVAFALPRRPSS